MKDPNRVYWNEQFRILQDTWPKANDFEKCIAICLNLHGMVHTTDTVNPEHWSFENELWQDMSEEIFRRVYNEDQSIVWKLWHIGRIEDITMNILIADEQQVMSCDNWIAKLNIEACDTGNAMNDKEIERLSKSIDIKALQEYRNAVGKKTRDIIRTLKPEDLKKKIEPCKLKRVLDEGAVVTEAKGLLDYWGRKTYAGLLLMPATRHNLVHLNESFRILEKEKRGKT